MKLSGVPRLLLHELNDMIVGASISIEVFLVACCQCQWSVNVACVLLHCKSQQVL